MKQIALIALSVLILLPTIQVAQSAEKKDEGVVNFDNGIGSGSVDEQDPKYEVYVKKYFAHYHAADEGTTPVLKDFSEERDAQGRPKWFDGQNGEYTLKMLVIRLFVKEQFNDLEKLIGDWNGPDSRTADGRWKLSSLPRALVMRFQSGTWDVDYQIIQHWKQKFPESAGAAIAEAVYWKNYAWHTRGNGFANSVSQEGWKLFSERMSKSEKILLESGAYASSNPEWYAQFLSLAKSLQWPKDRLLKFSDLASRKIHITILLIIL